MKKLLTLLLSLFVLLSLSGCELPFGIGGDDVEVEDEDSSDIVEITLGDDDAGDAAEVSDSNIKNEEDKDKNAAKDDELEALKDKVSELESKLEEKEMLKGTEKGDTPVKPEYSGDNYITLNSPSNDADIYEVPVIFKGVVSPNTTKIVVTATNAPAEMGFYEDVYTLQDFDYGDSSFTYRASMEWNNLFIGTNDYEFVAYFADGSKKSANLSIFYSPSAAEVGKPVIYLYPKKAMKVSVNVEPTGGISISEPELKDGWEVFATPNSKIYNFMDRTVYPYLFWEGYALDFKTPKEGFVVAERDISSFFDEKLSVLGLNSTEITDFKEFWLPRLSGDSYYFVTFIPKEEFDKYAPLTISPEPDSIIRVFFDYKALDKKVSVEEQVLKTPVREGFAVVEWGGRLYR